MAMLWTCKFNIILVDFTVVSVSKMARCGVSPMGLKIRPNVLNLVFNPFVPKSDQVQIPPAASPVILHHTVWRTWLPVAY